MAEIDKRSPYYPYPKVSYAPPYIGIEDVPRQLVNYLLDLPLPGYTPPDDNTYPRAALIKYLYYDTPLPLNEPLPTTEQKLSIVYDATKPETPPDAEKGYRIFPLSYVSQAQTKQQTIIRIYMGRGIPRNATLEIAVVFDILASTQYESNMKGTALSRTFAIEQCILQSLDGVNINGVGGFYYDKSGHPDCGSQNLSDERMNVGRRVIMGLSFMGGEAKNEQYAHTKK